MAFERPLEADRVDDLGFMSSFVRAPIVGPIMWILGGDLAKRQEKEEEQRSCRSTGADCAFKSGGLDDGNESSSEINKAVVNAGAPDAAQSDVSDEGDSASSVSDDDEEQPSDAPPAAGVETLGPEECCMKRTAKSRSLCVGRRKLSFSDEVPGKSLVEYCYVNEAESMPNEPPKPGSSSSLSSRQPVKSAMKKSGSFRSSTSSGSKPNGKQSSSFVPSGIVSSKGGGVVMPSGGGMPTQQSSASVGTASPQWGWYISTTPPTPEQYYSSGKVKALGKKQKQAQVSEDRMPPPVAEDYPMPIFKNSPTPVFQKSGAKDVFGHDTMGWPSVPL